ncbi:Holliday junction resolvase RuvX [candidate division NPL-UPA2 bacterium Unc8]|uniref:Putative pre-16S rRNA nuclease n=1 Tax=candidate division NPL-UPA2 bacterium Unc8 TaxID=1980939 RepID=A0A399FWW9_UNCN2|nr:putative pre-16S rRNA nuclease [Bacillota bacterium]MBT9146628.1 putative pre-16S rRNA nuclease [Bacillota bacterium]RIH99909.1 MAG: Holliday junction resolvase RuvX [candidate division NPL-UPA2 bacterium Unc8]
MRILGLDVGDKTIGIALSDELHLIAQAFEVIKRSSLTKDFNRVGEIAREYQVERVIVGLPLEMSGKEGKQAKKVIEFIAKLCRKVKLPVETWDERLTTSAAERHLLEANLPRAKRKQIIHKVAAQEILQGYLDCQKQLK